MDLENSNNNKRKTAVKKIQRDKTIHIGFDEITDFKYKIEHEDY